MRGREHGRSCEAGDLEDQTDPNPKKRTKPDYSTVYPTFLTPRFSWSEYIYRENNVKPKDGTFSTGPTGF